MYRSAVVVEGSMGTVFLTPYETTHKTAYENQGTIYRTLLSWQQKYCVPWFFCDTRRFAEITTFRLLEGWFAETKTEEFKTWEVSR